MNETSRTDAQHNTDAQGRTNETLKGVNTFNMLKGV